ncbi:uncharacterized protein EI90DRAFT_3286868 [Cantharellus anzutake]|uniref:uncharacterized protein n=1 Tax=Cantharellus anzutake TaxID=1750568 RepID=UPI0019071B6B|nr:uncharacterized protein EI90DRAFT_3286868 [Cantharellus anzutake]KAF8338151.1 hypothetical protein EI90DRAFT_3286868 [Cantharellus anzutake]
MAEAHTGVHTPTYLPYPVKIMKLLVTPDTAISRGTALCNYSFEHLLPPERPTKPGGSPPPRKKETRYETWESPVDGIVQRWQVRPGDIITTESATKNPAIMILEECTHKVQIHGLCAICGKDMTNVDYLGFSDASRASIRMTHDANGPTVSMEEAHRYDQDTSRRLLGEKRLSLIVDLDQTIVHATVDPTVGEWIEDSARYEAKKAAQQNKDPETSRSATPPNPDRESSPFDENDVNPNWEALKDVKKFKLGGEGQFLRLDQQGADDGTYYYIKPRPGLVDFLDRMKTKYEMHVYTMGTRAYALEVCKAIDLDGTVFGQRVLTRDESGSMTAKNLARLFPSDQSMVVIIDDRADVWSDVPNLVKVVPYDFFVGIGDINSAHLPKLSDPITSLPPTLPNSRVLSNTPPATISNPLASPTPLPEESLSELTQSSPVTPIVEDEAIAKEGAEAKLLSAAQTKAIEAVVEQRPLAKMQEKLDKDAVAEAEAEAKAGVKSTEERGNSEKSEELAPKSDGSGGTMNGHGEESETKSKIKIKHQMLLHNNDFELTRIEAILTEVHRRFYDAYANPANGRPTPNHLDVRTFIQAIKAQAFASLHFTFSNVFPINIDATGNPIWRQAEQFGATCHTTWNESVTHVIALKLHSEKTDRGQRKAGVFVVHPQWLWDSVTQWRRVPEAPYEQMLLLMDATSRNTTPTSRAQSQWESPLRGRPRQPYQPNNLRRVLRHELEEEEGVDEVFLSNNLQLGGTVDWAEVDREVDEFLNESDDDDIGEYEGQSDASIRSSPSTASRRRGTRKRPRSGSTSSNESKGQTEMSPLAKRLKLSQGRRGKSGLKIELLSARQSENEHQDDASSSSSSSDDDNRGIGLQSHTNHEAEDEAYDMEDAYYDDSDSSSDSEEDDFLARDFDAGGSWG